MATAQQLAEMIRFQQNGIGALVWESKVDLINSLLIIQAAIDRFPDSPIVLPTVREELERFSIELFESEHGASEVIRMILVAQASVDIVGRWLNGWRRRLAEAPGTLLVVRSAEFNSLFHEAPDLMSFVQGRVYDAMDVLPLVDEALFQRIAADLPSKWQESLSRLPGAMPLDDDRRNWIEQLKSNLE